MSIKATNIKRLQQNAPMDFSIKQLENALVIFDDFYSTKRGLIEITH
jgi:hypothetical protein